MSASFNHPKVNVHIGDGFEFLKDKLECYDVIITDSSDPVGPAESLFQPTFFELLKTALKPDGIICSQGECVWLHLDIIRDVLKRLSKLFPVVDYAYTTIPTYPSGQIGFFMCSKNPATNLKEPKRKLVCDALQYYTLDVHRAAFVLPAFAERVVRSALDQTDA